VTARELTGGKLIIAQQRNIEAMKDMQQGAAAKRENTPAVQLVAGIIKAAVEKGASDIHIEPQQGETVVRFRIDGILRDFHPIPRVLQNQAASRVKILSDMDILERRTPQGGRFLVRIGGPGRVSVSRFVYGHGRWAYAAGEEQRFVKRSGKTWAIK
jgi:type II secretory ATPase GspE/PulE/Tfp pilus assembly ATPase PilB-like protein